MSIMEITRTERADFDTSDGVGVQQHVSYIESLVADGGPDPSEYAAFNEWLIRVADDLSNARLSVADLAALRRAFGPALSSTKTMQGLSYSKPRGYSGDFEIIDRIYRKYVTDEPELRKWDLFCQAQSASAAVRNRKEYFIRLLERIEESAADGDNRHVLNVASGPCRDLLEFFHTYSGRDSRLSFECIDVDADAIEFAKGICEPYLDQIQFTRANALRYVSDRPFDLIWSAGLFDYLGDKAFKFLLEQLLKMLNEGGELVIGNFSKKNPTRPYMEIVADWHLYHRSEIDLMRLARSCGVADEDIYIGREAEGVNLFLHIKSGRKFIAHRDRG